MNEQLRRLYDFTLGYIESLLADVPDEEMATQPRGGGNPPAWIVGHLAVVNDAVGKTLGLAPELPEAWGAEFGPGSSPAPASDVGYPPKDELLTALRASHARVREAVSGVDLATLTDPNPIAQLRRGLPTVGDLVAHCLSTHAAMHAGHLSSWRRQTGRPPLL
ncbi:MAG: DinB family protein [Planctomycetota bacterium]